MDASYDSAAMEAGLGIVVRDANGLVCLSAVTKVDNVSSPFQAEVMALLFGMQTTDDHVYKHI